MVRRRARGTGLAEIPSRRAPQARPIPGLASRRRRIRIPIVRRQDLQHASGTAHRIVEQCGLCCRSAMFCQLGPDPFDHDEVALVPGRALIKHRRVGEHGHRELPGRDPARLLDGFCGYLAGTGVPTQAPGWVWQAAGNGAEQKPGHGTSSVMAPRLRNDRIPTFSARYGADLIVDAG